MKPCECFEEHSVARHRIIDSWRSHQIRDKRTCDGNDDDRREDTAADRPEHNLAGLGSECLVVRHPARMDQIEKYRARQDIDRRDGEYADHESARQIAFGVFDLTGYTRNFPPSGEREKRPDNTTGKRADGIDGSREEGREV